MPTVDVRTATGTAAGTIELDGSVFGVQPNVPLMHQVVTAQLAAARRGTQSTKTRAEVSGGGAKPFRQKGTGRARQGSTRAPHWSGGGIALGPKPRSYRQRTPKKMIRLALACALSDRLAGGRLVVVDGWGFEAARTKDAVAALAALEVAGKVVVVVAPDDEFAIKSFRNLPDVQLLVSTELNAYDVLCSDYLVFTTAVLPGTTGELVAAKGGSTATAPTAKKAAAAKAAPAQAPEAAPAQAPEVAPVEAADAAVETEGAAVEAEDAAVEAEGAAATSEAAAARSEAAAATSEAAAADPGADASEDVHGAATDKEGEA
jgi:large subunit ribosomal protein L4